MNRRFACALTLVFVLAAAARAEQPRLFFWQIKSGKATAYLLGSIHVARPSLYPLDPQIEKAFSNSHVLAVEADASPEKSLGLAVKMLSRASYPPDDGLDKHISKETFDALVARLSKVGMPAEQVRMFKPWFLASTLMLAELQKLDVQPQYGLDFHFLQAAKGKPIIELEGAEAQIDLLDGFTAAQQEQFLQYTLRDLDNLAKHVHEILDAWSSGDVKKIEDYLLDSSKDSPEMRALLVKLFDERNARMAAKIEQLLQTDRTHFIIVGAGHLVGKNGLLQLLGKTHRLEQLRRAAPPARAP
jgi:uncharacterized protein YbaP (TraB family)